jgi:F-type H+-transporting ATPase subunit delta
MQNPRLADRYAKSLIDLALEQGTLEEVYKDAQRVLAVCKASREFAVMLKSPIIKGDKKAQVINILSEGKISELMRLFLNLLVRKGRESFLQEILVEFCAKYDFHKGISRINLATAQPVSDEIKQTIKDKLLRETRLTNIDLITEVDESLIGGFVLEYNNYLLDRSVRRFLKEVKTLYKKNEYIYNIR